MNQQTLQLLTGLEQIARAQNEVGKGTLQDVLKTQIEADKLGAEIGNLEHSRHSLMAQFKAALGMTAKDPEPPVPSEFVSTELDLTDEELFDKALAANLQLKGMEAEIRQAEASIRLVRKERVPDFSAGSEVDVKASPFVWNPQLSMSLPIWRDKIAAEIAEAQANKRGGRGAFDCGPNLAGGGFRRKESHVSGGESEFERARRAVGPTRAAIIGYHAGGVFVRAVGVPGCDRCRAGIARSASGTGGSADATGDCVGGAFADYFWRVTG